MKKNFIYQVLYQVLALLLPLITAPYLTRVLGAERIGIYSYTNSIVNYFMMFAMLGFNTYGMRTIAQIRDDRKELNKEFSSIFALQFIISLSIVFVYILYLCFFVREYKLFFIIQTIYILGCAFDINWFYFGIEKFKITVIRNTLVKLFTLLSILIFVKDANDLWKYTIIMTAGTVISQTIMWSCINKYVRFIKVLSNDILKHLKPVLLLFIPTIALSIYKVMDKIMLGNISGTTQVGYYESSEKIINIVLGIINALGTVMMSRMSNIVANNDKKLSLKYIDKFMNGVMYISIAMSIGLISISDKFIPLFYGKNFETAINLVIGLAITIPFSAFSSVIRMQYLIPNNKDKEYIISLLAGAITNVIINLIFIRGYGALGAVFGTIAAEFIVCVMQILFSYKELEIYKYMKQCLIFYGISIVMFLIVRIIINSISNSIISIILGVFIGAIIYLILGLIYFIRNRIVIYK